MCDGPLRSGSHTLRHESRGRACARPTTDPERDPVARFSIRTLAGPPTSFLWESDRITVGRAPSNDLVLTHSGVSRVHLEIYLMDGRWLVEDKGSTNGTQVNGMPLEGPVELCSSDEIAIGEVLLVFHPSAEHEEAWLRELAQATRSEKEATERVPAMIGKSESFKRLMRDLPRIACSESAVLILGENGTGKELLARQIHVRSPRAAGPFVVVNCPALPGTLLEAELFGVERGVATGVEPREGRFEAADGGTLLLDEIGDLDASAQAKILRALQEHAIERVGGREPIRLDVRVLAATNHDLRARVSQGTFRRDLYHRLKVIALTIPPLRERREDIGLLADHFLRRRVGSALTLSPEARGTLEAYSFPGNVRELLHIMERAAVLARGSTVRPGDLPQEVLHGERLSGEETICKRLLDGDGTFWELVREPFLKRDLSAADARAVVRFLYERNGRSYRKMAVALGIEAEYRKLVNFLNYHRLNTAD